MKFNNILYLDDLRSPLAMGIHIVKDYNQFVDFLNNGPMPDLISFDHDLSIEHYALFEQNPNPSMEIPYEQYREKTGLDCAKYIIENKLKINYWAVHSMNPVGAKNILDALRAYHPDGEVRGLNIQYRVKG